MVSYSKPLVGTSALHAAAGGGFALLCKQIGAFHAGGILVPRKVSSVGVWTLENLLGLPGAVCMP